ncbi:hypothetical protein MHB63_07345 [Bacillus sp. FSL H8-0547]
MGHDICGYNQAGEEIAYLRFSMGNGHASIVYGVLDADEFNGGVSGTGSSSSFSMQQIEKALNEYRKFWKINRIPESEFVKWEIKQIQDFLSISMSAAEKEGNVRVSFS